MNRKLINTHTLSPDAIQHELFIRYGDGFKKSKIHVQHRVLTFKAHQILMGDSEGFPLRTFTQAESCHESHEVQNRYEQLCIEVCRNSMKKLGLQVYFTELLFLYARAYHLNALNTDDSSDALLAGITELLWTHYAQRMVIPSTVDSDSSEGFEAVEPSPELLNESHEQQTLDEQHDASEKVEVVKPPSGPEHPTRTSETVQVSFVNEKARPCFRCGRTGHQKADCNDRRVRPKRVRKARGGPPHKGCHL